VKLNYKAVVVVAVALSIAALTPKAASAVTAKSTANSTLLVNTNEWSGYSVYPSVQGDTLTHVSALWAVPKVTCPTTGIAAQGAFGPRAAVWVGLTGTLASIFTTHNAWLPQIGTNSKCLNGKPQYSAVYELYHACNLSDILACFQSEQAISGFKVNAGDTIYASVTYSGATSSSAQKFQLTLVDYASGGSGTRVTENVQTLAHVPLLDAARQGLAIVENVDEFTSLGIGIPGTGGLAQFKQPVQFVQYAANGELSGGLSPIEYDMLNNGKKLAVNSYPLSGDPATGTGNFTVTWKATN
jgi:Peptidase A4 family